MQKLWLVLALAGVLTAGSAQAAQVHLTYAGYAIPLTRGPSDGPDVMGPFTGGFVLDESLLGGSVANRTLTFYGILGPNDPSDQTTGIVSWNFSVPLYSYGGTQVSLTFGAARDLVGWVIDALDGPPDYRSSTTGDVVFGGNGGTYSNSAPGIWTTTVVPLPAPALGLFAGLTGLVLLRRQRV